MEKGDVRRLGDVSNMDFELLDEILPHCTVDQLRHVEMSTKGRDLSPVTDKLWKKFFIQEFGMYKTDLAVFSKNNACITIPWMQLYDEELKKSKALEDKVVGKLKTSYQKDAARKQSRQIRICSTVLPSKSKSSSSSSSSSSSASIKPRKGESLIMKKARREFLNSLEVQNLRAMKKNSIKKSNCLLPPPVENSILSSMIF